MWRLSTLLILPIFITGFLQAQTSLNAYGLGFESWAFDAASLGAGNSGLLPLYQEGVSLSNPTTWQQLRFVLISTTYGGQEVRDMRNNTLNGLANLDRIEFIMPIKQKFAWGFSVKPLYNLQFSFVDDSEPVVLLEDTVQTQKSISSEGGISTFNTTLGFPITKQETIAFTIDWLFGSNRRQYTYSLDNSTYLYFHRNVYSGSQLTVYVTTTRFKLAHFPATLSSSVKFVLQPLRARHYSFQPFEDANGDGIHDFGDFPDPAKLPEVTGQIFTGLHRFFQFNFGTDVNIRERTHLLLEGSIHQNKIGKPDLVALFPQYPDISSRWSLGGVRFSRKIPRSTFDRFHFRGGLYYQYRHFYPVDRNMNEYGISLGFGLNFGATNNQIDVGFLWGRRTSPLPIEENFRQFNVSLSLGDVWFVKRRAR